MRVPVFTLVAHQAVAFRATTPIGIVHRVNTAPKSQLGPGRKL
jgi:hypothetical protein